MRALLLACLGAAACYDFPLVGKEDLATPDLAMTGDGITLLQLGVPSPAAASSIDVALNNAPLAGHLLVAVIVGDTTATVAPPMPWTQVGSSVGGESCNFWIYTLTSTSDATQSWSFPGSAGLLGGAVSEWSGGAWNAGKSGSASLPGPTFENAYALTTPESGGMAVALYCQQAGHATFKPTAPWLAWWGDMSGSATTLGVDYVTGLGDMPMGYEYVATNMNGSEQYLTATFLPQ
jgi:hypothetical protein